MPRKTRPLMQQAYDEIKRRIITLELRPGEYLDDLELSKQLSLSRTPIREAIFLLGSEGLVDIKSNSAILVRPLDLLDTADLIEVELMVAKAVARLTALRIGAGQVDELRRAAAAVEAGIKERDPLAVTASNANFHRLEAGASGNHRLNVLARSIEDERQRLAYFCFGGTHDDWNYLEEHFRKVVDHHGRLIDAYKAHDPDGAEEIAIAHVLLFRDRILQYLSVEHRDPKFILASARQQPAVSLPIEHIASGPPVPNGTRKAP